MKIYFKILVLLAYTMAVALIAPPLISAPSTFQLLAGISSLVSLPVVLYWLGKWIVKGTRFQK